MSKTQIVTGGIADDAVSEEHIDATVITGSTELAATPADTDELLISDAGTIKRIDYSHLKTSPVFNLIAATDLPSEGTSFTMDNVFSDTYDKYVVFGERFRTGGRRHSSADVDGSIANAGDASIAPNVYNDTEFHFMMHVFYPTNTGVNTVFQGKTTFREGSTSYSAFVDFGYISISTEDHTGFKITSSSGNFNSTACRLTVYGITDGA
jgi:hypothetical protein